MQHSSLEGEAHTVGLDFILPIFFFLFFFAIFQNKDPAFFNNPFHGNITTI